MKTWIFWPVFFIAQLLSLALLAWHLLAQWHFAYPLGYQLLNLAPHIAEYAPQNRFRSGFEHTSPEEHWRLFGEITDAVQDSGKGLSAISYSQPSGEKIPLMHEAEIVHLQDVANLIDRLYFTGIVAWMVYIGCWLWIVKRGLTKPSSKAVLVGFGAGIAVCATAVLGIGPTAVFYWLHEVIFPPGHPWFFYYQDSLMTTLMKAPDIFAFIGLLLVGMLAVLWVLVTLIGNRLSTHLKASTQNVVTTQ